MKCAYYLFFLSRFALLFFHMHFAVTNYFFSKLLLVVVILEVSIYFWIGFCNGKNNSSVLIVIYKQCFSSFNIVPHLHWHLQCHKYLTVTFINTKNGYKNRKCDWGSAESCFLGIVEYQKAIECYWLVFTSVHTL